MRRSLEGEGKEWRIKRINNKGQRKKKQLPLGDRLFNAKYIADRISSINLGRLLSPLWPFHIGKYLFYPPWLPSKAKSSSSLVAPLAQGLVPACGKNMEHDASPGILPGFGLDICPVALSFLRVAQTLSPSQACSRLPSTCLSWLTPLPQSQACFILSLPPSGARSIISPHESSQEGPRFSLSTFSSILPCNVTYPIFRSAWGRREDLLSLFISIHSFSWPPNFYWVPHTLCRALRQHPTPRSSHMQQMDGETKVAVPTLLNKCNEKLGWSRTLPSKLGNTWSRASRMFS